MMKNWLMVFLVLVGGLLTAAGVLLWLGNMTPGRPPDGEWKWLYYFCVSFAFLSGGLLTYSLLHRLRIEILFVVLVMMATVSFIGVCLIQMSNILTSGSSVKISSMLLGMINGFIIPVLICVILYRKNGFLVRSKD